MSTLKESLKDYCIITAFILACGLAFLVAVPVMGLVVSRSWNWFLAPIAGLRTISLTEGVGLLFFLAIVGTMVTATLPVRGPKPDLPHPGDSANIILVRGLGKMVAEFILAPLVGLGGAWVWHTFMISPP